MEEERLVLSELPFGKIILDYLKDDEVTDIQIWGGDLWYTAHKNTELVKGGRHKADLSSYPKEDIDAFNDSIYKLGRQLAIKMKKSFNEGDPFIDGETDYQGKYLVRIDISDGSVDAYGVPAINIRKLPYNLVIDDTTMISDNYASKNILDLFEVIVKSGNTFCAIGPTGTGKTTLLKYLIRHIPDGTDENGNTDLGDAQAIITMEDTLEAWIKHIYPYKNVQAFKTNQYADYKKMIYHSLRMNPDWLIISEVRGEEVLELFEAISTGHKAMTSLHADSAQSLPDRMVEMSKLTGQGAERVYIQAHRSIDIGAYIHMWYDNDGVHRMISEVCEYYIDSDNKPHEHLIAYYDFEKGEYKYEKIKSPKIRRRIIQNRTSIRKIKEVFW